MSLDRERLQRLKEMAALVFDTRSQARGSAKEAVPTCTATAPASSISTASRPEEIPPTPTIGRSGSEAWQS